MAGQPSPKPLRIATHLPEEHLVAFAAAAPGVTFLPIPAGSAEVPAGTDALLALPLGSAGSAMPAVSPPGWPFDLRWIQLLTVGLDYYPDWFLRGPIVTANQGLSGVALAEFAMAAMLAAAKGLPDLWIDRADAWKPRIIDDLSGQTLGIFGFGSLGEALAVRAHAFGMRVIAVRKSDAAMPPRVERSGDIADLIRDIDHLVLAAPAGPDTRHILNEAALRHAKPGLHVINIARGSLIDESALIDALDSGRVARATLDVLDTEPPAPGNPLLAHPRAYVSPHSCTMTPNTIEALVRLFGENVVRLRTGQPLRGVISNGSS